MRRLLLLATLLSFSLGCGVVPSPEEEATDAAREAARKVGERMYGQSPRTAEEIGRSAAGIDGVEVLRLTGTSTRDKDGVDVVVRTSGSAYEGWLAPEEVTVRRCFTVRVSRTSEWGEDPRDVDCPDSPPLAFAPPPEPPRLPYEELRARLPRVPEGGRVDEAEVRRALARPGPPSGHPQRGEDGGRPGRRPPLRQGQRRRRAGLPARPGGPRRHGGVGAAADAADAGRRRLLRRRRPGSTAAVVAVNEEQ